MPRRKGISHKQRSAQTVKQQQKQRNIQEIIQEKRKKAEQQEQEQRLASNEGRKKKTESDVPVGNGVQRTISAITNHVNNQDGGGRYLHKKFKKVVEMEETQAEMAAPVPGVTLATPVGTPVVNGHPPHAPSATAGDTPAPTPTPAAANKTVSSVIPESSTKEEVGAGRYVCRYCNMACAKPSVLEKHIRAHTNERPYPCVPCGFSFKTKSNLYKHCRSRAHTLKMEEEGADPSKFPQLPPDGEEDGSSDGREDILGVPGSLCAPAATPSSALPGYAMGPYGVPDDVAQAEPAEPATRNIYKPKFHPAAFQYHEENGQRRPASAPGSDSGPGSVAGPGPDSLAPGLGLGSGPGQSDASAASATPSPESLQRRITKLISENKAIVETTDPLWAKKFSQRLNSSSPASSPAPSPSPGAATTPSSGQGTDSPALSPSSVWHKKFLYHRQVSGGSTGPTAAEQAESNSKLALALMGPKPTTAMQPPQPLQPQPMPPSAPPPAPAPSPHHARSVHSRPDGPADPEAPLNLSCDGTLDLTQPHKRHSAPPPAPSHQPHQPHHPPTLHQPLHHQPLHHQYPPSHMSPALMHPQGLHLALHNQSIHLQHQALQHHASHHHQPLQHQPLHHHQQSHHQQTLKSHHAQVSHQYHHSSGGEKPPTSVSAPASLVSDSESAFKRVTGVSPYHADPHQSVDGSVIKDILLKSKAAGMHYMPPYDGGHALSALVSAHHMEEASYLMPNMSTFQCHGCKAHYRSAETLRKHVMYCTKAFTPPRPPSGPPSAESSPRHSTSVVPPQPSPGPLLGNTPLVDSYNHREAQLPKKRRLDLDVQQHQPQQHQPPRPSPRASPRALTSPSGFATPNPPAPALTPRLTPSPSPLPTTLRSLEELSRSPVRTANSLQMFGGQVQILDNAAGEPTTLRIEPSGMNMGEKTVESSVASSNSSPQQMVVTIAKSGLQTGGGTIVQQVPASASDASMSAARSAADMKSKAHYGMASMTSVADATHLVIPFIPNIATPNLAIKGIPAPSHLPLYPGSHMASHMASMGMGLGMGHHLGDGSLLNPLTNITAFNPLTLAVQPQPPLPTPPQPSPTHATPSTSTVTSSSSSISYGGGVLTIVHGGRAIPHVPGMPGPTSQMHAPAPSTPSSASPFAPAPPPAMAPPSAPAPAHAPSPTTAAQAPPQSPTASLYKRPAAPGPAKDPARVKALPLISSSSSSTSLPTRSLTPTTAATTTALATPATSAGVVAQASAAVAAAPQAEKRNFSMFSAEAMKKSSGEALGEVPVSALPNVPSIRVEPAAAQSPKPGPSSSSSMSEDSGLSRSLKLKRPNSSPQEREDVDDKRTRLSTRDELESKVNSAEEKEGTKTAVTEATRGNRFLRPTSLPLKPGTFTPKRHLITPNVLSLMSPETPRPKKSYGQLYLNGHAYTYLGLKCSTRPYFCTLNRLQPTYVPLSPDHSKLSMYSNWKVYDPVPDPCGLSPSHMIALYDSRHRPAEYTISGIKTTLRLTHSSYWLNRVKKELDTEQDVTEEGSTAPKRIKIFKGGFESNEDYTYIRGRGRGRYVCEECGIRCKKPSMLKKHIRTHTDVRPFTCRHCSFSFKTKGNLTKHMKSKAHYKKCMEMGIIPVPTVVDDSYIDEASLARQQALRGDRGEEDDAEDSEDNEDEDDEDDDDEDDEDDDEFDVDDDMKGSQEREAAKSLLSLSQTAHLSSGTDRANEKKAREAGLVGPKGARCLSTYPYQLSAEHPRRITSSIPGTPTLAPISEHKEREKVSHNTGLARDIHEQGVHLDDGAKPLAELNTEDGHHRYYFPSSRIVGGSSAMITDAIKQESKDVEGGDSTADDENVGKVKMTTVGGRISTTLLMPHSLSVAPRTPTTPISEILTPVSEPAFLLASLCSTMEKLPVSLATPTDPPEDSAQLQNYLRERAVQDARVKQSQYHPRIRGEGSDVITPVGTPGTPTSCVTPTMTYSSGHSHSDTVHSVLNTTTFTSVSQLISSHISTTAVESVASRPPPLVWAVQKASIANEIDGRSLLSPGAKTIVSQSITCSTASLYSNVAPPNTSSAPISVKQESVQSPVKSVPVPLAMHSTSSANNSERRTRTLSEADADICQPIVQAVDLLTTADIKPESLHPSSSSSDDKLTANQSVIANVPSSGNDALASSVALPSEEAISSVSTTGSRPPSNSVIVANSGSSSPPLNAGSIVKKPKAEFMPPSSGPAPSYVSVTDDGRSKCTICNKVFSKPSQLHLHVNIHYFERPFRCDACAVSFRTRGHLQKHERSVSHHNKVSMNSTFGTPTTTNPRPYKCDDCKSAFRIHGHLAKHLRSKMHIMKLECVGKLPFGTYAEIERAGLNMNDIDTTDCDSSLESLLALAKKLCEKDPTKLNQWKQPESTASDIEESSDEGEPIIFHSIPFPDVDTGDEDNAASQTPQSDAPQQPIQQQQQPQQPQQPQPQSQPQPPPQSQPPPQHQNQHLPPRLSSPNTSVPPAVQTVQPQAKQEHAPPRTNTTAAAAAAAAVAAAAVAAAASAPASRVFSGISGGSAGSNGIPSYISSTMKMDGQPTDKPSFVTTSGSLPKDTGAGINHFTEQWRYNSVTSRLPLLSNNKDIHSEIKAAALDRRLGHLEQTRDLQDKTVDSRTGVCEVPNKTDMAYGVQSLHSPANR